jgi:membrane-associated protease RseP (regulator of RpoE activity)
VVAVIFPQVAPGSSSLEMGTGFVAALFAVVAVRYLAQRYGAKRGNFSFLSYYLPNIPVFIALPTLYFLPTFGSVSFPGTPPANRNKLFDFYLIGSLAMVAVALAVAFLGAGTSVVLTQSQLAALSSGNQTATIQTNPSILQSGVISIAQSLGLTSQVPPGGTLIFSPVEIAAWLGLMIAFFNLMPAALFDGGRMARLAIGESGSRLTTIASGLFLLATDIPNYWVVFLLVFLMAAFPVQGETLDSISGLSRSRKAFFALAVVVGVLCVPTPQTFATLRF